MATYNLVMTNKSSISSYSADSMLYDVRLFCSVIVCYFLLKESCNLSYVCESSSLLVCSIILTLYIIN